MDTKKVPEAVRLAGFKYEQRDKVHIDGKVADHSRTFYRGENANFWPSEDSFGRDDFLGEYCAIGKTVYQARF